MKTHIWNQFATWEHHFDYHTKVSCFKRIYEVLHTETMTFVYIGGFYTDLLEKGDEVSHLG